MDDVFEGGEHLERELTPEPVMGPAAGAVGLHLALALVLAYSGWILGLFHLHHNEWGGPGGGAMQVSLVSSALPLPSAQVNQNVLATETPSQAPAEPSKKEQHHEDETAIPITGKQAKPVQNINRTQQHQPPSKQQNLAQYGEQAGSVMPHQMQYGTGGPATVGDNSFASLYSWYVDQINRKMNQSWNKAMVDPRTPKGQRVYLIFTIHRDGSVSDTRLDKSSGSPTLDRSCQLGVQRVDTFGNLPAAYHESTLQVGYYCEY